MGLAASWRTEFWFYKSIYMPERRWHLNLFPPAREECKIGSDTICNLDWEGFGYAKRPGTDKITHSGLARSRLQMPPNLANNPRQTTTKQCPEIDGLNDLGQGTDEHEYTPSTRELLQTSTLFSLFPIQLYLGYSC